MFEYVDCENLEHHGILDGVFMYLFNGHIQISHRNSVQKAKPAKLILIKLQSRKHRKTETSGWLLFIPSNRRRYSNKLCTKLYIRNHNTQNWKRHRIDRKIKMTKNKFTLCLRWGCGWIYGWLSRENENYRNFQTQYNKHNIISIYKYKPQSNGTEMQQQNNNRKKQTLD